MIASPKKKEMLLNLGVMLEHARVLADCTTKFPEFTKDLKEQLALIGAYKKKIDACS